ncbi:hypothetical protein CBM2587_A170052 [Cupriavidus taiwanensis]|uniref:Uncharacterized protein n=1 Tax=Cupriavidus taiwanensis TaxID=164546 RepID=A0A975ZZY5_9BURK|nr:hypothetical protein CBM2587_A170052 [Cupriavidus taiwanensis]
MRLLSDIPFHRWNLAPHYPVLSQDLRHFSMRRIWDQNNRLIVNVLLKENRQIGQHSLRAGHMRRMRNQRDI